jgi:predicted acylesterase/phospholipase RssA
MEGGITSGIVYPPLVLQLKEAGYHFRNVGGTSAGAIAAALTAAAEYGSKTAGATGPSAFEKLNALKNQFTQSTFIRDLFQPSQQTRPLLDVLLEVTENVKSKQTHDGTRQPKPSVAGWTAVWGLTKALMRHNTGVSLIGVGTGVVMAFLLALLFGGSLAGWGLLPAVMFAWLGLLTAGVLHLLWILVRKVPENYLGICTGLGTHPQSGKAVLTEWLSERFNDMAGKDPADAPLTFGELNEIGINLKMMTSNLSQNRPYVLPFQEDELFIFKAEDFQRLFPAPVVKYLTEDLPGHDACFPKAAAAYSLENLSQQTNPDARYYFLPKADALPVIVATRMSLSFPILLSAVPLYTIKAAKADPSAGHSGQISLSAEDLQLNWLSDGGICSNFPLQFFDAWLPTRPTIGINLTSMPSPVLEAGSNKVKMDFITQASYRSPGREAQRWDLDKAIFLPKADDLPTVEVKPLGKNGATPDLLKFLWAIFATAQNYRDNTQSVLPGYRERIVQVRLHDHEGGLNLAMPDTAVAAIVKKGEDAGKLLVDDFNFQHHQWVRFRVLMMQVETRLAEMAKTLEKTTYWDLLESKLADEAYPYACGVESLNRIKQRLDAICRLIQTWDPTISLTDEPLPLPEPILRVMPEL